MESRNIPRSEEGWDGPECYFSKCQTFWESEDSFNEVAGRSLGERCSREGC